MVPASALSPTVGAVPASAVHLTVRYVHVLAATLATGGAALVYAIARAESVRESATAPSPSGCGPAPTGTPLAAAAAYEWVFWGAVATLVATGVGNLGAFAPALPRGRWGVVLSGKLLLVLVVLALSTLRTLAVCRLRDGGTARDGAFRRRDGDGARALCPALGGPLPDDRSVARGV